MPLHGLRKSAGLVVDMGAGGLRRRDIAALLTMYMLADQRDAAALLRAPVGAVHRRPVIRKLGQGRLHVLNLSGGRRLSGLLRGLLPLLRRRRCLLRIRGRRCLLQVRGRLGLPGVRGRLCPGVTGIIVDMDALRHIAVLRVAVGAGGPGGSLRAAVLLTVDMGAGTSLHGLHKSAVRTVGRMVLTQPVLAVYLRRQGKTVQIGQYDTHAQQYGQPP